MKSAVKLGMVILGLVALTGLLVPSGAWAVEEIKIGVIYPLTGGAAAAGRELRVQLFKYNISSLGNFNTTNTTLYTVCIFSWSDLLDRATLIHTWIWFYVRIF